MSDSELELGLAAAAADDLLPAAAAPDEGPKADFVVSARKYRPQTFKDLTGQNSVARALSKAIEDNRIPHALLFSGPRGVGKTTSARILAKALNCDKGPTPNPCGVCRHCIGITQGSDLDVVEIDGASNTGVDNIRELRERVNYSAFSASWKVYIIDEVHMLSQGAFNALLKTLEEPPPRVIFIFATTEPDRVPQTIRSRCSWFQFGRISARDIADRLSYVVDHESDIRMDPAEREEILMTIAQSAEGGMRDALVTLDQLVALCEKDITLAETRGLLGLVEQSLLIHLIEWLVDRQTKDLLQMVHDLAAGGQDFERLAKSFCLFLRDLLIIKATGGAGDLVEVTGERFEAMQAVVHRASPEQLLQYTRAFLDLEAEMKMAAQPRVLLEYTLIKLTVIDPVLPLDGLIRRLEALERGAPAPATAATGGAAVGAGMGAGMGAAAPGPAQGATGSSPRATGGTGGDPGGGWSLSEIPEAPSSPGRGGRETQRPFDGGAAASGPAPVAEQKSAPAAPAGAAVGASVGAAPADPPAPRPVAPTASRSVGSPPGPDWSDERPVPPARDEDDEWRREEEEEDESESESESGLGLGLEGVAFETPRESSPPEGAGRGVPCRGGSEWGRAPMWPIPR